MPPRPAMSVKHATNTAIGVAATAFLKAVRLTNPGWLADAAAAVMRRIGPYLPEHKVGRANLVAAYPEKSPAEIDEILLGVWDNVGRVAAEFAHLDRLWDFDPAHPDKETRMSASEESHQRMLKLRDDGKPALVFTAHLGNWEMAAVAATFFGLDTAVLYRRPNIAAVADAVIKMRAGIMGDLIPTGLDAPVRIAQALERGAHVGMLVDQHTTRGVNVTFFGRPARTNPLIARLARHFDCPIHGLRVVRKAGHRFWFDLTEPVEPTRDAEGKVDVQRTMQRITDVVEGWVREHPEQWLWLHRRWR